MYSRDYDWEHLCDYPLDPIFNPPGDEIRLDRSYNGRYLRVTLFKDGHFQEEGLVDLKEIIK